MNWNTYTQLSLAVRKMKTVNKFSSRVFLTACLAVVFLGQTTAQLSVSINYTAPNCPGYNSGLATAQVSGGVAPYNYYWSNGQSGQTIGNPNPGTLSVTVTDATWTTASANTNVTVPAPIQVNVAGAANACAPGNNYLTANVTGGTPPYSYGWSNGASGSTAFNLQASGYYFVTVTDSKGCIKVGGANFSMPVAVTIYTVPSKCGGTCDGSIEAKVTGGTPPYSFQWSNGPFPTLQQQAPAPEGLYSVTVTDGSGCTATATGFLDDPDVITISFNYSAPCSAPTNVTAIAAGGVPPYTYQWGNGQWGATAYSLQQGTWLVNVIDANGCAKEAWVDVTVSDMQVAVNSTPSDCAGQGGGSATVSVSGGSGNYTYKWSNGSTDANPTNLVAGTYTVTVTDGSGCEKTATVTVEDDSAFSISTQSTPYRCDGHGGTATVTVNGTGNYTFAWNDASQQNSSSATNLEPGSYSVVVTDENGCSDEATIDIADAGMQVSLDVASASCDDSGNAEVIVTNATGQVTYNWSNGATGATASALAPGSYSVTVTDELGCSESLTFEVENTAFDVAIEVLQQGCPGEAAGILQASVVGGGNGGYTFQWDNWGQSNTIGGLVPGAYTVTVTDATGCSKTASIALESTPQMNVAIEVLNSPCQSLANGNLEVTVAGGVTPFTYQWSTGGVTSPQATNLAAGTYTITVTDGNGCTSTASLVLQNENMELEVNLLNPTCENTNDGTAIVNVSGGGAAPYSYQWSTGSTEPNLNNLAAGSYTITVTDAAGCQASQTFVVEPQNEVEADFAWATLDCDDNGVLVQFSGQAANAASWLWTLSNGQTYTQQNPQIFINQSPMTVTLTVTTAQGCEATTAQSVDAAPISLNLLDDATVCQGEELEINLTVTNPAGGTLTYDWSPDNLIVSGQGTPNPVFASMATGQFTLSVAVSNGTCTVTDQTVMNVTGAITVDPSAISDKQCTDLTVDFTNTSNLPGTWYFDYPNQTPSSTEPNPSYTYGTPGTYNVTFVPDGACAEALAFSVEVTEPPVVSFTASALDCVDPVTVTFTNTSNVPGGITNFYWDFGSLGTSTEPNPSLTVSGSQTVNATLVANFGDGCSQTVEQAVSVDAFIPPVLAAAVHPCSAGETVELNPNGDPAFTYQWSGGNLSDPTAANPTATVTETTTYTVVITAPNGCSATQNVTVEVPTTLFALTPMDNIVSCDFDPVMLVAQPNAPAVAYVWSSLPDFSNPVGSEQSLEVQTGTQPITYYVLATDAHGCTATASLSVQNAAIDVDFDKAFEACKGEPVDLELENYEPEDLSGWLPFNPFEEPVLESTEFTFLVSNDLGCTGQGELVINVVEFSLPIAAVATPKEIWAGKSTTLSVLPAGNYSYLWSPVETLDDPTSPTPVATPEGTTTYTVEVTDLATGCRSSASIEVKVKDVICDEPYVYLPNAFTPNGDGLNDVLKVEGFNVEELYMAVYDRWGEKVFETNSLDHGWDGSFRGQTISGDVYGYYLKVKCPGGLEFFKKGNITVLR
jgi:gliding motility-associated-like protein